MTNVSSSPIKLCIFDFDDTLVKTRESKIPAIKALGERYYGVKVSDSDIRKNWGLAHHILFSRVLGIEGKALDTAIDQYKELEDEFPNACYEDAKESISKISNICSVAILSSCNSDLIKTQLSYSKIDLSLFSSIFGAKDTEYHKPSCKVFNEILSKYNHIPKVEIIYIGDGVKDMKAALEAGIRFVGLNRDKDETEEMRANSSQVVNSLAEVVKIIESSIKSTKNKD